MFTRWLLRVIMFLALTLPFSSGRVGAATPRDTTTLSVWIPSIAPYQLQLFAEYAKTHPGITISSLAYTGLATNDSQGKLRAAVLGHHSPDLVYATGTD